MNRLAGRVAIVTGAGSGIGRAMATKFAAEGASVAVVDRNYRGASETVSLIAEAGGRGLALEADVTSSVAVDAAFAAAVAEFGACDIAVANAGISVMAPIVEISDEQWHRVLDVDLNGAFYTVRAAARAMLDGGRSGAILCTTSAYHGVPAYGQAPYCAAKSGVVRLVECASLELGPSGIRVVAIAPGVIRTPLTAPQDTVPGLRDFTVSNLSLPRLGEPEDVATLAAFLASDDAAYITGHTFYVDGGMVQKGSPDFFGFMNAGSTAPINWGAV